MTGEHPAVEYVIRAAVIVGAHQEYVRFVGRFATKECLLVS